MLQYNLLTEEMSRSNWMKHTRASCLVDDPHIDQPLITPLRKWTVSTASKRKRFVHALEPLIHSNHNKSLPGRLLVFKTTPMQRGRSLAAALEAMRLGKHSTFVLLEGLRL